MGHLAAVCALIVGVVVGVGPAPAYAAPVPKPHPDQWHLTKTWRVEKEIWPHSQGEGVIVAVIDTGVDDGLNLPGLRGGAVLPGVNMDDDAEPGTDGRWDINGHGTEMAALIASRGTDGDFVGLAPKSTILPVRIFTGVDVINGIRWAADHDAKVINISVAGNAILGRCSKELQESINYALERDVVIVASAGNDGNGENLTEEPASCPGVVAVGAVDESGEPWEETQRKPYVAVAAPGAGLVMKDYYGKVIRSNGTSNASALVSATAALIRAKFPDMSAREVVQRIIATAEDVGPTGWDDATGYGLVQPARALTEDVPADAPNPVYDEYDALRQEAENKARLRRWLTIGAWTGGALCLAVVVLVPVLLLVWSVRRDRKARQRLAAPYPGRPL